MQILLFTPYVLISLFSIGIIIVFVRYHHTRALIPGLLGFAALLIAASVSDVKTYFYPNFIDFLSPLGVFLILSSLKRLSVSKISDAPNVTKQIFARWVLSNLFSPLFIAISIFLFIGSPKEYLSLTMIIAFCFMIYISVTFSLDWYKKHKSLQLSKHTISFLFLSSLNMMLVGFAWIVFVKAIYTLQNGSWFYVANGMIPLLVSAGFTNCSVAIFDRLTKGVGRFLGIAAFSVLSLLSLVRFSTSVGLAPIQQIEVLLPEVEIVAWIIALVFLMIVPRPLVETHRHFAGFEMTKARWTGMIAMIIGGSLWAWQVHELNAGEHLTVWIILGFIPVPLILLGAVFLLGGLIPLLSKE